MVDAKLNPTLFEKLTSDDRVTPTFDSGRAELQDINARVSQQANVFNLDRYTEGAMRASVRRELSWLLNTVRLGATQDLSRTPHVQTSVLNYGLPDLTGRSATGQALQVRARDIENAIKTFEPRLDPDKLKVEAKPGVGIHVFLMGDVIFTRFKRVKFTHMFYSERHSNSLHQKKS